MFRVSNSKRFAGLSMSFTLHFFLPSLVFFASFCKIQTCSCISSLVLFSLCRNTLLCHLSSAVHMIKPHSEPALLLSTNQSDRLGNLRQYLTAYFRLVSAIQMRKKYECKKCKTCIFGLVHSLSGAYFWQFHNEKCGVQWFFKKRFNSSILS